MKKIADEQIIAAIMEHGTIQAAAVATGAAPRTIYDRMLTKPFKAMYQAARADVLRGAAASLNSQIENAVATIEEIMLDREVPPAVRLQAANSIIAGAEKFADKLADREEHMINPKVTTLEEMLSEM